MVKESHHDWILLVARLLLAALFVVAGYGKLMAFDNTVSFVASVGIPMATLAVILTIILELGGGLLLALGWQTKLTLLALMIFTVIVTFVFHFDYGDQTQQIAFLKNAAVVGGMLYAYLFGPGHLSIDSRCRKSEVQI